jgi:hypothetical protein
MGGWDGFLDPTPTETIRSSVGGPTPPWPPSWSRFSLGDPAHALQKHPTSPAFPGYVIGWYQRLDGARGYVLQHERDRIVHVYPERAVAPGLGLD